MSEWIKLHSNIRDHWIWQRPDYLKWWIDLLLQVNHKPAKILINGKIKIVDVGECYTSEIKLAERWSADRRTVRTFLKLLKNDSMIEITKSKQEGTTIKVLQYKDYQALFNDEMHNAMHNAPQRYVHKQK